MTMKRLIATIALLVASAGIVSAQPAPVEFRSIPLTVLFDTDYVTGTPGYCVTTGAAGNVNADNRLTKIPIAIAANATTVTSTGGAFNNLLVGDILYFVDPSPLSPGAVIERVITARASANSITIDSVVSTLYAVSQQSFEWRKLVCGTTAASGWVPVESFAKVKFSIAVNQIATTTGGIDFRVECREQGANAQPFPVSPTTGLFTNKTAAGITGRFFVEVDSDWRECRVGMQFDGTDDGVDTGAAAEQVTIRAVLVR